MDLTETDIVVADDERPNRQDGTCFYCRQAIGLLHKPECVIVSKSVVVRFTVDAVVDVPRSWKAGDVDFKYRESGHCFDNVLELLGRWVSTSPEGDHCSCGAGTGVYQRSATAEDHRLLPVLINLPEEAPDADD